MKIPSSLLLPFLLLLLSGCTRTEKSYDAQGNLRSEISYRGDHIHGKALWYYHTGQPQQEFNYRNGLLEGPSRRWYFNGQLESETHYREGKKQGPDRAWGESGTLLLRQYWVNDTLHGRYEAYFPNGKARILGKYARGYIDSTWTYTDAQGLMVGQGVFEMGQGSLTAYYPGGKARRYVPYRDNEKHGWEVWMNRRGDTLRKRLFEEGILREERLLTEDQDSTGEEMESFGLDADRL